MRGWIDPHAVLLELVVHERRRGLGDHLGRVDRIAYVDAGDGEAPDEGGPAVAQIDDDGDAEAGDLAHVADGAGANFSGTCSL